MSLDFIIATHSESFSFITKVLLGFVSPIPHFPVVVKLLKTEKRTLQNVLLILTLIVLRSKNIL